MKRLSLALAALLAVGGAQAATVSFQYGLPLPLALSTTEINQTGTLGLFNSSLGTLTAISLTVYGAASFQFTGTNTAAQSQTASITGNTSLVWSSSIAALTPFLSDAINLTFSSGAQTYAVGQTRTFGPELVNGQSTDNLFAIRNALSAAGGGTFTLNCVSLSGLAVQGGGGNIATTQATRAGCGAQITYTYDVPTPPPPQVPEPASLALVGLALAGAAAASRRRRQG